MHPFETSASLHYCYVFQTCCCDNKVTFAWTVENEMILKTLTQRQLQWHALLCDHSNLAWPICVPNTAAGPARLKPYTQIHCLLRLASTSDLRMNMLSTVNTGPVTACLPPACAPSQASPKIKQIIITECNHPRQRKGEKNICHFSHLYKIFLVCLKCALPLPVILTGSQ